MEIIIVRHGLSQANVADILGTDLSLAPKGKRQATELAQRLSKVKIDAIYCSPYKRARQTAQPVADEKGLEVQIDNRIREVVWGDFDGKTGAYFEEIYGESPRHLLDSYDFDFHKYHGENVADLEARIRAFVEDVKSMPFKTVLVVCHGGPVRMLNYVITGQKIPYQQNGHEIYLEI